MKNLNTKAIAGVLVMLLDMAGLIFVPAGTLDYWQAWLFLAVFSTSALAITLYLMKYDRPLLERRMRGGPAAEKEASQKIIMSIASIGFVAILVVSALDHRFHWSALPVYLTITGEIILALGWLGVFFVFRENPFASATIELDAEQKVVSTGLYSIVRHPMYTASLLYFAGIPISLGSWWGLLVIVLILPVFVWRLLDEEAFLVRNLPGYTAYQNSVRYRLAPFIW